ncbi:alkanesulfonate monooxygenase [Seinonella peptonophila]|uniref:Alkanesulfonate monooxygenase n=1 Tax=Seinonella peptonophila TaxID=112248 RepID=A0A1M5BLT2_9BACL|nr:LLM class flavin-dependent oxidoreductase [Seinonella peptonophila]SHF43350.1 alkanesulfonate monooxygenase [Seinonella peptonophila]
MEFVWWLPSHGDGRYFGVENKNRGTDPLYLQQVAQAVEFLGYDAMFLGTGSHCEDPWITASSLIHLTQKVHFILAQRPNGISPTVASRMVASFDRISKGRIALNLVSGISTPEMLADGISITHDQRYEQAEEFLAIFKQLLRGEEVTFQGSYFQVDSAKLNFPPTRSQHPPLYFGGTSEIGREVAARHADTYLLWGEPPKKAKEIIDSIRMKAEKYNRKIRFGMCLYVIVREKESEAWAVANELIKHVGEDEMDKFNRKIAKYDADCLDRRTNLIAESPSLKVGDHLWAGTTLADVGPLGVVGDPESVANCLLEYVDIGVTSFTLAGIPHLEEAYRVAELVLPRVRAKLEL